MTPLDPRLRKLLERHRDLTREQVLNKVKLEEIERQVESLQTRSHQHRSAPTHLPEVPGE